MRRPKLLVLDEPTSALDQGSEQVVLQALECIQRDASVSVIVIAHRLSTIQHADVIALVVDAGAVLELGTHEQLMGSEGAYASLVQAGLSNRMQLHKPSGEDRPSPSSRKQDVRTIDFVMYL